MEIGAATVRNPLTGIVHAVMLRSAGTASGSINAEHQRAKRMACGFRKRRRLRNATAFHRGVIDLYPASVAVTHAYR